MELHDFMLKVLAESETELSFKAIHESVSAKFNNFFTKDLIAVGIDDIYKEGHIVHDQNNTYRYL